MCFTENCNLRTYLRLSEFRHLSPGTGAQMTWKKQTKDKTRRQNTTKLIPKEWMLSGTSREIEVSRNILKYITWQLKPDFGSWLAHSRGIIFFNLYINRRIVTVYHFFTKITETQQAISIEKALSSFFIFPLKIFALRSICKSYCIDKYITYRLYLTVFK